MIEPIENNFRAETATELVLIARIEELKRKLYQRGYSPIWEQPDQIPTLSSPPPLRLNLAAYGEVTDENDRGRWRVEARTYGPSSFGTAVYITQEELMRLSPHREADLLAHHMQASLRSIAKAAQSKMAG